ncbi:MAG: hypothetical protein Q4A69_05175 [Moraxella sp.]|nr:hypothetical protein [Moraxella sp.]
MNILLFGHTGFIGQNIYRVIQPLFTVKTLPSRSLDFNQPNIVPDLFDGIDLVINAIGVMSNDNSMEAIHHHTPKQLATIAKQQGVKCWINLSALGADSQHPIDFLGSKGRGDKAILDLSDDDFKVSIIRPSLVFGKGGVSTELFLTLAKMPIWILPNDGRFIIQPVHVDDVTSGVLNIIIHNKSGIYHFVGKPILLKNYLKILANNFYQKQPKFILSININFAKFLLKTIYPIVNNPLFNPDNLTLLQNSPIINSTEFIQILGYQPTSVDNFCF